jgi:HK97 family phage prohead protease
MDAARLEMNPSFPNIERKFCLSEQGLSLSDGFAVEGYASLFGIGDHGGDIVQKGAFQHSLQAAVRANRKIKMLWQHDPAQPIGIWDELREDAHGLYAKGRLLEPILRAREAAALIAAGALDGLSVGYTTKEAGFDAAGARLLNKLELWEISLVTFPMLPGARVSAKADEPAEENRVSEVCALFRQAARNLKSTDQINVSDRGII